MSQIKYYIVAFLFILSMSSSSQNTGNEDVDLLQMEIQNKVTQAGFDIDRGNYFNAKDNLQKALEIALKIDDKKEQGIIGNHIVEGRMWYLNDTMKNFDKYFDQLKKNN